MAVLCSVCDKLAMSSLFTVIHFETAAANRETCNTRPTNGITSSVSQAGTENRIYIRYPRATQQW